MNRYLFFTAIVMALALIAAPEADAAKKRTKRRQATPQTLAKPQTTKTPKTIEVRDVTLEYDIISTPAYYKLNPSDCSPFCNGYSNNSFYIDWPNTIHGGAASSLQFALIKWLGGNSYTSIDELIAEKTQCTEYPGAKCVASMPKSRSNDSPPLFDTDSVYIMRFNPQLIVYASEFYVYEGGMSRLYGMKFLNYDITQGRVLKLSDIVNVAEATKVLRAKIKRGEVEWPGWGDAELSEEFCINNNSISIIYQQGEVGSMADGMIEVELTFAELAKCFQQNFVNKYYYK